jgi:ubiquinone/menaquinone biosynthesis C-methylase UbiE
MGYVFDFHDAKAYEQWSRDPRNQLAAELESRLMLQMLTPNAGETLLDIGCGTGMSIKPLLDARLQVTGLDPSPYMLDLALAHFGQRIELYRGVAEDLPFDDNSFNYACFFCTLEFVNNPKEALAEACRVAKDKIFIGLLNRYAVKGIERWIKRLFTRTVYDHARFYGIWEIKRMVRDLMGPVPVSWRTVCQFPNASSKFMGHIEKLKLVQRCPFGTFAGIVITLVPRFRTRPLALRYQPKQTAGIIIG